MIDLNYIETFVKNNVGEKIDFSGYYKSSELEEGYVCGFVESGSIILGFNDSYGWNDMSYKIKMHNIIHLKEYKSYYAVDLPIKYRKNN